MNWDTNKNKIYEDDDIIVLLATDTKNPNQTGRNCKKFGANLKICICNSSGKPYCYEDRWVKKLTVHFVWLKNKKRFIIVDVYPDGSFSYNGIESIGSSFNLDIKDTMEKIVLKYPELKNAFKNNVFKSIPIQKEENEFFKRLQNASSIFEFDSLNDRLDWICMPNKVIIDEQWKLLIKYNWGKRLFKEFITTRGLKPLKYMDVPDFVLEYYPSLKHRYWNRIKKDALINMHMINRMSRHEKIALDEYFHNNPNNKLKPKHFFNKLLFKLFGIKTEKYKNYLKQLLFYISLKKTFLCMVLQNEVNSGLLFYLSLIPCPI